MLAAIFDFANRAEYVAGDASKTPVKIALGGQAQDRNPQQRHQTEAARARKSESRGEQLVLWRDYWDAKTLLDQQPADWLPVIPRLVEAGAS